MSLSKSTYHSNKTIENFSFSSEKTITKKACYDFLYEKENHLGNVHVVVSDRKLPVDDGVYDSNGNQTSTTPDGIFDYYEPDVVFAADYYAGVGQIMPGRLFISENYRYGAQGSEVDEEIDGTRDRITTFYRNANLKTLRWDSPDPVTNPSVSPYAMNGNNGVRYNDPQGDCETCKVEGKASLSLTFGTKGQSSINFAAGIGVSSTNGGSMTGANLSLNLSSGGFGSSQVSTGKSSFNGMLTLGLSYTKGSGEGTPTDLNIFTSNTVSGITNNFQSSFTLGTNLSLNNATGFNRAWSIAGKSGGFTATLNEDYSWLTGGKLPAGFGILGSGYDQDNTGGGFLGYTFNNGTTAYLGTEIFTGAPTGYPKESSEDYPGYVAQTSQQQSYNVGRTFLKVENFGNFGNIRFDYSGQSQMWSQNAIHDFMGIDRFKSSAPNSFQITR